MSASRRQTVLIIDDTPFNIEILYRILAGICDLTFTTNGPQGIELAASAQPDLILLDVVMPEMDGYEVCAALKAEPCTRDIPVIFVTALGKETDEARGLEIGAIDYITKPISPPIVRARVRNHLELRRQRDILQRLSSIDGLTGVANRRAFDHALEQEWRRALRTGDFLSLLMIDVDYFKPYNDQLGHVAGDDGLKQVAAALEAGMRRPGDLLTRYGGEEFACVLPQTSLEGAVLVAEHLRQAVAGLSLPHPASAVAPHLTVSLGGAALRPADGLTAAALLERADRKLYEAKHGGRNRVAM
jgi:diguanylate cyclase (GGDEF)-like protein